MKLQETKLYLCLYQYQGPETEGNLSSDRKFICRAGDEAEALWMYQAYLNSGIPRQTLSAYRGKDFASGGWGWFAYQLHESQEQFRDDTTWFLDKIRPFRI